VAEGSGRAKEWVARSGVETRFFDDVLVPGVKALSIHDLEEIKPFDLEAVKEFTPDYLAGWSTVLYDRSLSDASLLGREQVMKKLHSELIASIEIGKERRNLNLGGGSWSGMTFKHVLLPIWTGTYQFQGKEYRFSVNGQTGKVDGQKPRDTMKVVFATISTTMAIIVVLLLLWIILNPGRGF
jgi:hypothetical protein